jgi:hypothetical protein
LKDVKEKRKEGRKGRTVEEREGRKIGSKKEELRERRV